MRESVVQETPFLHQGKTFGRKLSSKVSSWECGKMSSAAANAFKLVVTAVSSCTERSRDMASLAALQTVGCPRGGPVAVMPSCSLVRLRGNRRIISCSGTGPEYLLFLLAVVLFARLKTIKDLVSVLLSGRWYCFQDKFLSRRLSKHRMSGKQSCITPFCLQPKLSTASRLPR